jgi:phage terminase large subunit-like protein
MAESQYPESEKLAAIHDDRMAITEFGEWLAGKGIALCSVPEGQAHYQPIVRTTDSLVFEMYGIDARKLEIERREMLGNG